MTRQCANLFGEVSRDLDGFIFQSQTFQAEALKTMIEVFRVRKFARTGGLHAAGIVDATGEPLCVREDVGRHNAVDKVVGWALRQELLPLRRTPERSKPTNALGISVKGVGDVWVKLARCCTPVSSCPAA